MKIYEKPELHFLKIDEDVVTASGPFTGDDDFIEEWWVMKRIACMLLVVFMLGAFVNCMSSESSSDSESNSEGISSVSEQESENQNEGESRDFVLPEIDFN